MMHHDRRRQKKTANVYLLMLQKMPMVSELLQTALLLLLLLLLLLMEMEMEAAKLVGIFEQLEVHL
jgi:hypothetical protein